MRENRKSPVAVGNESGMVHLKNRVLDFINHHVIMKIGIILQTNKQEHIWNTFRFGITALKAGHEVKIFLMNEGSELDTVPNSDDFDISEKVAEYRGLKGYIYACGTCMKVRNKAESDICVTSTMSDLLKIVEESEKVLVFG